MPIVLGNWKVCTPVTFRLLDSKHVDSFFIDGSLRLSSFSRFHKHSDEQRLDRGEGRTFFVHKTNKNDIIRILNEIETMKVRSGARSGKPLSDWGKHDYRLVIKVFYKCTRDPIW